MTIEQIRQAVQQELAADLAIDMVAGRVDANPRRRAGCAWVTTAAEVEGHVLEENVIVNVRLFEPWQQKVEPGLPINPAPLETLADQIRTSLRDKQFQVGWFMRVTRVELDYDLYCVDGEVLVWQTNAFA